MPLTILLTCKLPRTISHVSSGHISRYKTRFPAYLVYFLLVLLVSKATLSWLRKPKRLPPSGKLWPQRQRSRAAFVGFFGHLFSKHSTSLLALVFCCCHLDWYFPYYLFVLLHQSQTRPQRRFRILHYFLFRVAALSRLRMAVLVRHTWWSAQSNLTHLQTSERFQT